LDQPAKVERRRVAGRLAQFEPAARRLRERLGLVALGCGLEKEEKGVIVIGGLNPLDRMGVE